MKFKLEQISGIGGGIFIGLGIWAATSALVDGFKDIKMGASDIEVKGYAETKIVSDFATWGGSFTVCDPSMTEAYKKLEDHKQKVTDYLVKLGISKDIIGFDPVRLNPRYKRNDSGTTNEVETYEAFIEFNIHMTDTTLAEKVSKQSSDLIRQGVEFSSRRPSFIYTKIDEAKVSLLADAAKDAKNRAEQIAKTGGGKIGGLKSVRQGVLQITPEYSYDVSEYGNYDTTSVNKTMKAVITAHYTISD